MKFEQDAWSKRKESFSRIINNSAKAMNGKLQFGSKGSVSGVART